MRLIKKNAPYSDGARCYAWWRLAMIGGNKKASCGGRNMGRKPAAVVRMKGWDGDKIRTEDDDRQILTT